MQKSMSSRVAFGNSLVELAEKYPNAVVCDADLGKSTMTGAFLEKFPDRHFQFGIAEQNMLGTAAGLAKCGEIPYVTSFAAFIVGRYETIRMSIAYNNANVKLIGTHAGIGVGEDGNSQMGLEDIAVLRHLSNIVIIQPADAIETYQSILWSAQYVGPVYFRLTRQSLYPIYDEKYTFDYRKGSIIYQKLRKDSYRSIAIFCSGGVVSNCLFAAKEISKFSGYSVEVVNISTLKPIDEDLILEVVNRHHQIITVEDHYKIGGLGSAISEVMTDHGIGKKLIRHGLTNFGESADLDTLYENASFSTKTLVDKFLSI